MIGTSTFDLLQIRCAIFSLRYVGPLGLLFCTANVALHGFKAALSPVPLVIGSIAVAETLFYPLVYLPYRAYLQRDAVHPPTLSRPERKELFERCNSNIPDAEAYLNKWFLGAPKEQIKKENLKDFFLWAFFNRGGPPGEDDEELEEYITSTEKLLGREIEPGRGGAKCLRLTLDRVEMRHRSLLWYLIVGGVDLFTYVHLLYHGFHFHRTALSRFFTLFPFRPQSLLTTKRSPVTHTAYWHRAHTSTSKLPILFIHGIGIGLLPYVNFLGDLNSEAGLEDGGPEDQVGIIAIEIMPISFRITYPALSKDEMCAEIAAILAHHGWEKVVLVAHSYGTVISTHFLKTPSTAPLIGPVVLVDPVSILLHLPDVAYNFTRRLPKMANEHQLWYFASMDMCVSHTLARHFFWSENVLWKEDIGGRNVTVSLSGRDLIVNTNSVGRYMASSTPPWSQTSVSSPHLIDIDDSPSHNAQPNGNTSINRVTEIDLGADEDTDVTDEWKERSWKGNGIDLLWFETLDHAQVFDQASTRRPLIHAIKTYCEEGTEHSTGG